MSAGVMVGLGGLTVVLSYYLFYGFASTSVLLLLLCRLVVLGAV